MINKKSTKAVYLADMTLKDVKCFKGEHRIDFTKPDGQPYQWTVILGNNNTGKTAILKELVLYFSTFLIFLDPDRLKIMKDWIVDYENLHYNVRNRINPLMGIDGISLLVNNEVERKLYVNKYSIPSFFNSDGRKVDKIIELNIPKSLFFIGYGTDRKSSLDNYFYPSNSNHDSDKKEINVQEWLMQLDYASKKGKKEATLKLHKVKYILTSSILPDIQDFRFETDEDLNNYVEFKTDYGWVRLEELGYGYQSSIAWLTALIKRMFDRYPESEHPLHEPAIVLVDEIDLHLHPEWQRQIIGYLSKHFPNVQFIVTAHSPLLVQSAEEINVVLLNKVGDHVEISQPNVPTFQGWTVDEILTDLMGMEDRIYSDQFLRLMDEFETGLDNDDHTKAEAAYQELEKIIHPDSSTRKLLRLQLASVPA